MSSRMRRMRQRLYEELRSSWDHILSEVFFLSLNVG